MNPILWWALLVLVGVRGALYTIIVAAQAITGDWGHHEIHHLQLWMDDLLLAWLLFLVRYPVRPTPQTPDTEEGRDDG